jgi:hypothetical protein
MPELTKTYQLNITVEQFLKACSNNELQEIDLLLAGYLNPKKEMFLRNEDLKYIGELKCLINMLDFNKHILNIKKIPFFLRKVFLDFLKLGYSLDEAMDAVNVVNEMTSHSSISADEVVFLMKFFSRLEKIRIQSLVKKPQALLLNPVIPTNSEKSD